MAAGGFQEPREELASELTKGTFEDFMSAVDVWIWRPQVINKRVTCSIVTVVTVSENKEERQLSRELIPKSSAHHIGRDVVLIGKYYSIMRGLGLYHTMI